MLLPNKHIVWRSIFTCPMFVAACLTLSLNSCATAFNKPYSLADKSALYISSDGKNEYYFSLTLIRMMERNGVKVVNNIKQANILMTIRGPKCSRQVLFTDRVGQRTDYRLICAIDYTIRRVIKNDSTSDHLINGENNNTDSRSYVFTPESKEGKVRAFTLLTRTPNLTAYFKREEEAYKSMNQRLAHQLVTALSAIQL